MLTAMDRLDMTVEELDTPALVIDLDAMERNIARMAEFFAGVPADLRPHAKTHKSGVLAQRQLAAGARGITCAKLGEAEVMVAGGIRDILIANQIVGAKKIARLVHLNAWAEVKVDVDHLENARQLSAAAAAQGVMVGVLVEVDVGNRRCGVAGPREAVKLAQEVARLPGLEFRGLMGYEGHAVLIPERERRAALCREAMTRLLEAVEAVRAAGLPVDIVSAGGTGTFDLTGRFPGITEVQAGSYLFMDARYLEVEGLPFEPALTVLATVISRPARDRAVTDAGRKALSTDFGLPRVLGVEGVDVLGLSEEHGKLALHRPSRELRVGDKLHFLPSHVCTTVDLHDRYYGVRGGRVEVIIDVAARGRFG